MKFRVSILNILCLIAVIGVWTAVGLQRSRTAELEAKLPKLRKISRELFVGNPQMVHSVRPYQKWFGEESWLVYIPDNGDEFELKINATRLSLRQPLTEEQIKNAESILLAPGEHRIELREELVEGQLRYMVIVDDQLAMEEVTVSNWRDPSNSGNFTSSSSTDVRECQSHSGNKRGEVFVTLKSCQYFPGNSNSTNLPTNGVALWIDNSKSIAK